MQQLQIQVFLGAVRKYKLEEKSSFFVIGGGEMWVQMVFEHDKQNSLTLGQRRPSDFSSAERREERAR